MAPIKIGRDLVGQLLVVLVHPDGGELLPVVEAALQVPEVPAVADPTEQQLVLAHGFSLGMG
jgi:hypothetical protein